MMGENSKISWTHHSWNPWWGCVKISPGCKFCYAEAMSRRTGRNYWGPKAERRILSAHNWAQPIRWSKSAGRAQERRRVFCGSMCDLFEKRPETYDMLPRVWNLIRATPHLDWILLTKRPENFEECLPLDWTSEGWPNVWIGVSIESMEYSGRAEMLREVPAVVRFISYEPALGPLDWLDLTGIDWIIYGGESGPHYRPDHDDSWLKDARQIDRWHWKMWASCQAQGVSFYYKQQAAGYPGSVGPADDANQTREFPTPRVGAGP